MLKYIFMHSTKRSLMIEFEHILLYAWYLREIIFMLAFSGSVEGYGGITQDQTTSRPNTLFDDADDIQRQLNNEARDKMAFGKPSAVWVFHLPPQFPLDNTKPWPQYTRHFTPLTTSQKSKRTQETTNKGKNNSWSYKDQSQWYKRFPDCGGRSQSPVDLPAVGLIKSRGCRPLTFINYDVTPECLSLNNNGKRLFLFGKWKRDRQPVIYGGAAHGRRYLFHSITLHWPSEHRIGGLQYPLESQVIHISTEYKTLQDAVKASPRDLLAILGIVNFYKFENYTQEGLQKLVEAAGQFRGTTDCLDPLPLAAFNPPMKQYVCYQGSLTTPPCTENVLWLVRAKALPVTRKIVDFVHSLSDTGELRGTSLRQLQPLNDRKVYFFN